MSNPLVDVSVTGEDIVRIYNKVLPAIDGESSDAVYLTFLAIALLTQMPELEPEKLVPSVKVISELVSMYVHDLQNPKATVN